ncbi:conserved hypothetical protein [Neospora caninum Liverpool]|uniref:Transmembrane protein n=1 Tax=Neospora caninum (strain Liverpool) TaxID=572307 RepID=F0VQ67_NEOCL|nr:conserved hypothetical protein [Neospora caninum Liverpool]CBZ55864.1 conserved hypothetical protein [Neospora caninum Liverpool]CEL70608.1 TPA: hypothetical protein BN1204_062900 [Neospora caninum Liverpool]|eukprot:XP_003885890.1 conserved hypothetical protein [Neospora caninum Liverpool]
MHDTTLRRGLFVAIFLFVFLGAFVTLDAYRYMWMFLSIIFGVVIFTDCVFFNEGDFLYDPFYSNWLEKTSPQY